MHAPHLTRGGRYPVLRALGILYLIVAAVAAVGVAIWALAAAPGSMGDRVIIALVALAGGFLLIISLLAVAEVLKLFIDLEHNTRIAALGAATRTTAAGPDGGRLQEIAEDETAEEALLRGH